MGLVVNCDMSSWVLEFMVLVRTGAQYFLFWMTDKEKKDVQRWFIYILILPWEGPEMQYFSTSLLRFCVLSIDQAFK